MIQKIVKKFVDKNINILFSNLIYTKENASSAILRKWKSNIKEGIQSKNCFSKNFKKGWMPPPHPTIFVKRNLLNKIKVNYDKKLKIFFKSIHS